MNRSRWLLNPLLLILSCGVFGVATIHFDFNGYRDVTITIHPDLPEPVSTVLISSLQEWIRNGSQKLFTATKKYAYIDSVKVIVPSTWNTYPFDPEAEAVPYENGDIRIEFPNPLYGDWPFTIQTGGCGDRGSYIQVPLGYLLNLNSFSRRLGDPARIFVQQWAKLRYGVFEEHGYPGDRLFPMFYYKEIYENGSLVKKLLPNYCTNEEIQGRLIDFVSEGSCNFDDSTNLPDARCIFVPVGNNSGLRSSIMSHTFLEHLDEFCEESFSERSPHRALNMNRQNYHCKNQDTWKVIKNNVDFRESSFSGPLTQNQAPVTVFKVYRPAKTRFVFVLDASGSMSTANRMYRLKQACKQWLRHDVSDGSQVAITTFSNEAYVNVELTTIDKRSREYLITIVDSLDTIAGTCLGDGIITGMDVLNGQNDTNPGGVIIFITDGVFSCDSGPNINDPAILERIRRNKIRVVTIAFGTVVDTNLKTLAEISNGKVYFVPDGDGDHDISAAFQGSLTYQPAVTSNKMDIGLYEKTFTNLNSTAADTFDIDDTIGRSVKIRLSYVLETADQMDLDSFSVSHFYKKSLIVLHKFNSSDDYSHFILTINSLESGRYLWEMNVAAPIVSLNVQVSSRARSDRQLPITTQCWASSSNGQVDLSQTKLAIVAKVSHGPQPVLNANVVAQIGRGDSQEPILLKLKDDGDGADSVANDGFYSRYFVHYAGGNGDYTLKCQVSGDDSTQFISGDTNRLVRRALGDNLSPMVPLCCGSNAMATPLNTKPTGNFSRFTSANSFEVINAPTTDVFPPGKVTNLQVDAQQITFTAPGDDYDFGIASGYDLRMSESLNTLTDESEWESEESLTTIDQSLILIGSLNPVEAGNLVVIRLHPDVFKKDNTIYYFAMRAYDESGLKSDISNVATFFNIRPPATEDPFFPGPECITPPPHIEYNPDIPDQEGPQVIDITSIKSSTAPPDPFPAPPLPPWITDNHEDSDFNTVPDTDYVPVESKPDCVPDPELSGKLTGGEIAGIVVGSIASIIVMSILVYFLLRMSKN